MKLLKYVACALLFFPFTINAQQSTPVYLDHTKPIEERIEDALNRMTVEEKVHMLHAQSKFSSAGVPRLGIPENWMSDGPHGIREEMIWDKWRNAGWTNDSCIAFPALSCLAATWNPELSLLYGKSIGEEARYRNKNVLLGPGANIYRVPLNGRNFEYLGEDPYLTTKMVVPYIQGVQSNGVAACVKHFALNNHEANRYQVEMKVDDRTLYEIYLPAFKAAVQEAKAWAIMGAYGKYKGQHCCHNQYLLNDILKGEWEFDGVVISDWGGAHDTPQAITNGLDMEFGSWTDGLSSGPSNVYHKYFLSNPYLKLINEGKVGTKELDDKVRRILRMVYRTTMNPNRPYGSFGTKEHAMAGLKIAQEGIVLLQNKNNILPIDLSKVKKILVVGENAVKEMTPGGGSSTLKVKYEVSPLQGIKNRVGDKAEVVYVAGYASPRVKKQDTDEVLGAQKPIDLAAMRAEAVEAARTADLVLFIGGLNKTEGQDCEGVDRANMDLPYEQNELISAMAKVNPNIVVSLISGNAVTMPWIQDIASLVQAWYNGTEAGNALASILFGDVNPSGKLPFTFPVKLEDNAAIATGGYSTGDFVTYHEGLFVGYRWVDKQKVKPLFPFGFGLSYTTFAYGKPTIDKKSMSVNETITVSIPVKNTGKREGKEIVQLYVSDKKSYLVRPMKELKGFQKVTLAPGEEKVVSFTIDKSALSFFDDKKHEWVTESGEFEALIGASSADIKGKVKFELK